MAMSRDRVHFLFADCERNWTATAEAAARAFGLNQVKAHHMLRSQKITTIVCRPSQFARFMIYRSEQVSNNSFAQFRAKLVDAECPDQLDVSDNPAERC